MYMYTLVISYFNKKKIEYDQGYVYMYLFVYIFIFIRSFRGWGTTKNGLCYTWGIYKHVNHNM